MDTHTLDFIDNRLNTDTAPQCALNVVFGADSVSLLAADASGAMMAFQSRMLAGKKPLLTKSSGNCAACCNRKRYSACPLGKSTARFFTGMPH